MNQSENKELETGSTIIACYALATTICCLTYGSILYKKYSKLYKELGFLTPYAGYYFLDSKNFELVSSPSTFISLKVPYTRHGFFQKIFPLHK